MGYAGLGLTVGIEVHQELATRHKLFCSCPPRLSDREPDYTFTRRLRPSQSELGEVDPAALFEFLKGKTIVYEAHHDTNCLVEMDEEPPGPLDAEAVDIALTFTLMTGGAPVDEVQVMRKTVVDGSNTGGFQRTSVVSLGGEITAGSKVIHLEQVAIEEDAARKTGEEGDTITYRLDRLGIPLIEITTAPEIHTPQEAHEAAARIGAILRATGMVRRGLGTIRQDVNVSIRGGAIIEIKGVQDLGLLPTVVEYEATRQAALLEVAGELKRRGVEEGRLGKGFVDVSDVFRGTGSKVLGGALRRGGVVLAVRLPGFAGLAGRELCPGRRLGTEMSDHARFMGNVKGIFHTDELPGYGVTEEEVAALRGAVDAAEGDAAVIVADDRDRCAAALVAVVDRARQALEGVPAETRAANPDGTTRFTRPRPGAARMYPETDVKPVQITPERVAALGARLPEMPEVKLRRFMEEHGLNEKLAAQTVDSDYLGLFEELAAEGHSTTLLAVTLTEDLTRLRRDGVPVEALMDEAIRGAFRLVRDGSTAKESLPDVLAWLAKHPGRGAGDALTALGLEAMSLPELEALVGAVVEERAALVAEMGMGAAGPLMGVIMGRVRGRAQPGDVQRLLRAALEARARPS
jgi:glutamyl-tRNA(Gln) amidotransferase subunit E